MNLLIIIEGTRADKPAPEFLDKFSTIYLLYLYPRIKSIAYKDELKALLKSDTVIKVINSKEIIDFYSKRSELLDFIALLPQKLKIDGHTLPEYLNIDGLNMWWASGIVEATPYKQNIFQNFYYLSSIKYCLDNLNIDSVWFQTEDPSLGKDLTLMLDKTRISYCKNADKNNGAGILKNYASLIFSQVQSFFTEILYSTAYKLFCPANIKPDKRRDGKKNIHLFHGAYPYNWNFTGDTMEHKIYKDLPDFLAKHLGGNPYYLSSIPSSSALGLFRSLKNIKKFWKNGIKFIPMNIFFSARDIISAYFSPIRYRKYFRMKKDKSYGECFNIGGIKMFHTFDCAMKESLLGDDARINLLYYYAYRNFTRRYSKNIFQIIYYLEFHSWETALIGGAKSADKFLPIVGLQQSAPNPTLLSFFFSPATFTASVNNYPLPDLILCSGKLYKNLMASNGIDPKKVETAGFLAGQYLEAPISADFKKQKKKETGIPLNKKICLAACSISSSLTEAVIYLVGQTAPRAPDIFFLIKGHPDTSVTCLLDKYGLTNMKNVKLVNQNIPDILPLADYFISASTSVSQEALRLGIAQVNLDIGGLPYANPLHMMPGLINDIETPDELIMFFNNPGNYSPSGKDRGYFLQDPDTDPRQKILNLIDAGFHGKTLA